MTQGTKFHYDVSLFPGGETHTAHFRVESRVGSEQTTVKGPTALSGGGGSDNYTTCIRVRQPTTAQVKFTLVFWLPKLNARFDKCDRSEDNGTNWTAVERDESGDNYEWKFEVPGEGEQVVLKDNLIRFTKSADAESIIEISVRPRAKNHPIWGYLGFGG